MILTTDGLSYREINEITGLTENRVGVALDPDPKETGRNLKGGAR